MGGREGREGHSSRERLKGAISVSSLGGERPKGVISLLVGGERPKGAISLLVGGERPKGVISRLVGDERPKGAISDSSLGGERLKGYGRVSIESFLMKGSGWFFRNSSLLLIGSIICEVGGGGREREGELGREVGTLIQQSSPVNRCLLSVCGVL